VSEVVLEHTEFTQRLIRLNAELYRKKAEVWSNLEIRNQPIRNESWTGKSDSQIATNRFL
jgi:hypothetical protein